MMNLTEEQAAELRKKILPLRCGHDGWEAEFAHNDAHIYGFNYPVLEWSQVYCGVCGEILKFERPNDDIISAAMGRDHDTARRIYRERYGREP